MPPFRPLLRPWIYALAGFGVGFLFLAEFALDSFVVVQIALEILALAGSAAALRGWKSLEMWPLFVAAAIVIPLVSSAHVAGLPRCGTVPADVACFAGARDVGMQLTMEVLILVTSLVGVVALIGREMPQVGGAARDN